MREFDDLLATARARVETAQIPLSLYAKAKARKAWAELVAVAIFCGGVTALLGLSNPPIPVPVHPPDSMQKLIVQVQSPGVTQ